MTETIHQIFSNAWQQNQIRKSKKEYDKIDSFLNICETYLTAVTDIEPSRLNFKCYHVIKTPNGRIVFFHVNSSDREQEGTFRTRHLGLHFIQSKGFKPHGLRLITRHWIVEMVWD